MRAYEDCRYTHEDVDKILGFTSWSTQKKIDTLFHIDCIMYSNLGTDSTVADRNNVKKNSRTIYRAIKQLQPPLGKLLLGNMD